MISICNRHPAINSGNHNDIAFGKPLIKSVSIRYGEDLPQCCDAVSIQINACSGRQKVNVREIKSPLDCILSQEVVDEDK